MANNLINVFLESYDYLTTLKIYNPLTYTQIINYVIDYRKTNTETNDLLREELKYLLKQKVTKGDVTDLKNVTDDSNLKKKLNKVIQLIPNENDIDRIVSNEILQDIIDKIDKLPKKDADIEDIMNKLYTTNLINYTLDELQEFYTQITKEYGDEDDETTDVDKLAASFVKNQISEAINIKNNEEAEAEAEAEEGVKQTGEEMKIPPLKKKGGRPKGSKDKQPRKPRTKKTEEVDDLISITPTIDEKEQIKKKANDIYISNRRKMKTLDPQSQEFKDLGEENQKLIEKVQKLTK